MNPVFRFFTRIGKLLGQALGLIRDQITDVDIERGKTLVIQAQTRFFDNSERREWVVRRLIAYGIPEFIARIVVELALRLAKKEGRILASKAAAELAK